MVGFINGGAPDTGARNVAAFRKGLSETGTVEGQNVSVEYHWLEGQYVHRTPALVAMIWSRRQVVAVDCHARQRSLPLRSRLQAGNGDIIPIVFGVSERPRYGAVLSPASLTPAAMRTGINVSSSRKVAAKSQLRLLHDFCVPKRISFVLPWHSSISTSHASIAVAGIPGRARRRAHHRAAKFQISNAATIGEIDACLLPALRAF